MSPAVPDSFQIIATLGPASFGRAKALAAAGATGFRINASHLRPAELRSAVEALRREIPDVRLTIDLQGAKMRLGYFRERALLKEQVVIFTSEDDRRSALPLPHPEIFQAARVGDTLTADDGRLRFTILEVTPTTLVGSALENGVLRPRKGVHLEEHPVELEDITGDDALHLASVEAPRAASWAFSFMKDGREAGWLRQRVEGCRVVAKIERQEAIDALPQIVRAVDELWICRGDLGEQLGPTRLARFVANYDPRSAGLPVMMAGQVLEHMTEHPEPTRSEICHLYDLVSRGYSGIVLSDETAIGRDPERAVARAASLVRGLLG
ncbi:MAG: pyruvate kinase [Myxococcales bacterium]|jgi:pyruvate kinase